MNTELYRIRGFRPGDYPGEARVWNLLDPGRSYSAEELRRYEQTLFIPPLVLFKVVAEERPTERPIGFGYLQSEPESFEPDTFVVDVGVDPDHRGRGVGLALANEVALEAERRHARRLWANAREDDPRGIRFLSRQGFTEKRRAWRSRLDLATAVNLPDRTSSLAQEGVSFSTWAEEDGNDPHVIRDLYDLSVAVSSDEPRMGTYTPFTLEQFIEMELRGPLFLPDAYFLARKGGRFVAMSALRRAEGDPETLQQSFTGTRREFRGRGIASELKRRAVEYGRQHGYRTIRTGNDSLNHPMLAINQKLGFQKERVRISAEKQLRPREPTGSDGSGHSASSPREG